MTMTTATTMIHFVGRHSSCRRRGRRPALWGLAYMVSCSFRAVAGFHDLLPDPSTNKKRRDRQQQQQQQQQQQTILTPETFVTTMQQAGISKIAFLRHGRTDPAPDGVDFHRPLAQEGQRQAEQAGASFGKDELAPFFGIAVVSPAPRAVDTARLFLQQATTATGKRSGAATAGVALKAEPVTYDGTMQPNGSALFQKIGYAPLGAYVNNLNSETDKEVAQEVLGQYAHDVANALFRLVSEQNGKDDASRRTTNTRTTLLFVGHSIYLSAAALAVASLVRCDDASQCLILSKMTGEAEGFVVDLIQSQARYLARPPPPKDTGST